MFSVPQVRRDRQRLQQSEWFKRRKARWHHEYTGPLANLPASSRRRGNPCRARSRSPQQSEVRKPGGGHDSLIHFS